jgi:hypothetical protein
MDWNEDSKKERLNDVHGRYGTKEKFVCMVDLERESSPSVWLVGCLLGSEMPADALHLYNAVALAMGSFESTFCAYVLMKTVETH